ncbi:hypothetical protein MK805_12190 [Shimazuella sp. AN120528]|uniref:hypothetical protein n=1 Tax=Shimazuella soli TaxID=1892854 RepID=UPI001F112532|nr:hypothetical protein [Shimazuella soli]MCH5585705.1 hypothetical protein [Shimazuella soli]
MQISSKDLQYLSDEMSWELIAFKKCHHFAGEVQDQQIKAAIDKIGAIHQQHYQALLQCLQSSTGQTPSQTNSYLQ